MFITLEGIEGSGKSTLLAALAAQLKSKGRDVLLTREPGATALGKTIRNLLLSDKEAPIAATTELFLFMADRAQHVSEVLKPALARGQVVLCDRYVHSTLAYQGYGRGLPLEQLKFLNSLATDGLMPDLVLLLDLEPRQGLERARQRAASTTNTTDAPEWNRFEQQQMQFHTAVRNGFLDLAQDPQQKIARLDAGQDAANVQAAAFAALEKLL